MISFQMGDNLPNEQQMKEKDREKPSFLSLQSKLKRGLKRDNRKAATSAEIFRVSVYIHL